MERIAEERDALATHTSRKSRPASGASSGSRVARAIGRDDDVEGGHSSEIRTPSSPSSTSRIGPLIPASIASRMRSDVASEMPGTWLSAARPRDSGMRRLTTVRPPSVTSTRSVLAGPVVGVGDGLGLTAVRTRRPQRVGVGAIVEGVEDRSCFVGGQPALGNQPEDPLEGVVRHRSMRSGRTGVSVPSTSSLPVVVSAAGASTSGAGRLVERIDAIERLESAAGLGDIDLAALERAQDAQSRVVVGSRDAPSSGRSTGGSAATGASEGRGGSGAGEARPPASATGVGGTT